MDTDNDYIHQVMAIPPMNIWLGWASNLIHEVCYTIYPAMVLLDQSNCNDFIFFVI